MEIMTFDELKEKEVINMKDCARLGFIANAAIDVLCGKIVSFTVKDCSCIWGCKGKEIIVPWECVTKIGTDIIFVDVCLPDCSPEPKKKRFIG